MNFEKMHHRQTMYIARVKLNSARFMFVRSLRSGDNEIGELQKRLAENARALSAAKASIRRVSQKNAQKTACSTKHWVLTVQMKQTAVAIYSLSSCAVEPSIVYLESCAAERHWPPRDRADIQRDVEDLFLATDSDVVAAITDHQNPLELTHLALAWKYVHEWNVVNRVRRFNANLGVAVPTRILLDYAEQMRVEIPECARPPPKGVCGDRRAEKWASLLRRRWGGRHVAVPVEEPMDPSELEAKVIVMLAYFLCACNIFCCTTGVDFVTKSGSAWWTRFLVQKMKCGGFA